MARSVEFSWKPEEFGALVRCCTLDDGVQLALRYLPDRDCRVLEAGCGIGRVVKYLHDMGYRSVQGIELSADAVRWVNANHPELPIVAGDILTMPYEPESFDVVLSFGVVEHFIEGLDAPLHSLWSALRGGGIAVITVPSFNILRRVRHMWGHTRRSVGLTGSRLVSRIRGTVPPQAPPRKGLYHTRPEYGPFFEYVLTPGEFEQCCRQAGFRILRSVPISHMDGLYHEFGPRLVQFEDWAFKPTRGAEALNAVLKIVPFFHNHMHACVVEKPLRDGAGYPASYKST
jgi:SAM-dependent methyltransferase